MPKYKVEVIRRFYAIGHVEVDSVDLQCAINETEDKIVNGELTRVDAQWGKPVDEMDTLETTGDGELKDLLTPIRVRFVGPKDPHVSYEERLRRDIPSLANYAMHKKEVEGT